MDPRAIMAVPGGAGLMTVKGKRARFALPGLRRDLQTRLAAMKSIRTDYEQEWYDIARFAQPARSRFLAKQSNRGARRRQANRRLLDPKGIEAFRTLTNGMTSGLSSVSTPWFALTLGDDLLDQDGVRVWLGEVEKRLYAFLAGTNFYSAVKSGYAEMGLFGGEGCVMAEHDVHGAVCHPLTAGEYWIALSDAGRPDTLYRYCPMTVRQMVQSFGDAVSREVRGAYDRGDYHIEHEVYQAIEPDPSGLWGWRSVYWDEGDADQDALLRVSGYREQPFWAPRWDSIGGDIYGVSPGMDALPALQEVQLQVKRRNEAIDLMVHPEKIVPPSVRLTGQPRSVVTGTGYTRDNILVPYQMPYQAVDAISQEVVKCYQQIDALTYADLFNAITNMRGVQPRNIEEIASRNEEKLTQLGPVIERVSTEKLSPAIDRAYGIMERGGLLPPAPPALAEADVQIEFVSILTQMQRMVGVGQIERTVAFIGNTAAVYPEIADRLDPDALVDEYAQRVGAPAKIIRSIKDAEAIREGRAAQQAQQQTMAALPAVKDGADAARLLSETDVGGSPLLDTLLGVA
jgi:hypothetical protein